MNSFMFVCLFRALKHEYVFLTRLAASTSRSVLTVALVARVAHPISLLKILPAIPEVAEFAAREIVVATLRARPVGPSRAGSKFCWGVCLGIIRSCWPPCTWAKVVGPKHLGTCGLNSDHHVCVTNPTTSNCVNFETLGFGWPLLMEVNP